MNFEEIWLLLIFCYIVIAQDYHQEVPNKGEGQDKNWFPQGTNCFKYTVDIQTKDYELVWTIQGFQKYFSFAEKFKKSVALNRPMIFVQPNSNGELQLEVKVWLEPNPIKTKVASSLQLKFMWGVPDAEFEAELLISSNFGNITAPTATRSRWVDTSFWEPNAETITFHWGNINTAEVYKLMNIGEKGEQPEVMFTYKIRQYVTQKPILTTGECPVGREGGIEEISGQEQYASPTAVKEVTPSPDALTTSASVKFQN